MSKKDYEQTFEDFWKDIVTNQDGTLNIDQIKRELHDFWQVMNNVSTVYDSITNGRYSKPLTKPEFIISATEEHYKWFLSPIPTEEVRACLHKKGAHMLVRNIEGIWLLDGLEIDQERAIQELAQAVADLGYWCQVAKDVLPENEFQEVQRAYEYHEE